MSDPAVEGSEDSGFSLDRLAEALRPLLPSGQDETPLGERSADQIVRVLLSEKYQGPFPHPDILGQLEKVVPGGAERAFKMVEQEQAHRHDCDRRLVDSEVRVHDAEVKRIEAEARSLDAASYDRRLLIVFTFILAVLLLGASLIAVKLGHPLTAGGLGISAIVSLVGGLLYGVIGGPWKPKSPERGSSAQ